MPRGQINKDEMKCFVMKLKNQVYFERVPHGEGSDRGIYEGELQLIQKYLNKVLDKIEEYRL